MNKKQQGAEYRTTALRFLARVGYATTRQVARAVFGGCDDNSRRMAQRTLKWLSDNAFVVNKRERLFNEKMFALSAAGASFLAENDSPLPYGKAHARDWLRHSHSHRTACNSVYAAYCNPFSESGVWSELEVRAGLAPLKNGVEYEYDDKSQRKIPDLLVLRSDKKLVWVEVENTWRSDKDLQKVIATLRTIASKHKYISKMQFVITAQGAKNIGDRLRRALTHPSYEYVERHTRERDAYILAQLIQICVLNKETLMLEPVLF